MSEAGERAEVNAAEVSDLGGFPASETVALRHGFDDPRVDGERFESSGAKQEDAVGDLFTDAGERAETVFGGGVGERFGFVEPAGMRSEELGGFGNVTGAETEQAGAEIAFGDARELGPGRER